MADPVTTTPVAPAPGPIEAAGTAPLAAASQPAVAPAPAAPVPAAPAPAVASPATPAPAAGKPAEPAPQPEQPAASVPTLLETFSKEKADAEAAKTPAGAAPAKAEAAPAKPAEPTKPGEAPPAKAAETPAAPAPVEYKYTLPETIQMDDTLRGEVHSAFDHFRANPAVGAQELINLHEKQMQQFAQFMVSEQQRIFKETRQNWQKQILADPEIGGSGHQTAMGAIARMRDLLVPENRRPAFDEFLRTTGAGDHPEFMHLLHQAARYFDEPPLPPPNPRPPAGNGQRPSRRLRDIYDHPRSTAEGRS
jgi:hypothetical protein